MTAFPNKLWWKPCCQSCSPWNLSLCVYIFNNYFLSAISKSIALSLMGYWLWGQLIILMTVHDCLYRIWIYQILHEFCVLSILIDSSHLQWSLLFYFSFFFYGMSFILQGSSFLNSLLEENLHSSLTSLPRLMRTSEDVKKIHSLNLVLGYLNLLEKRFSSLLNSSSHLRRLSLALVQVMKTSFSNFSPGPSLIIKEDALFIKTFEKAILPFLLVGWSLCCFGWKN